MDPEPVYHKKFTPGGGLYTVRVEFSADSWSTMKYFAEEEDDERTDV